MFTKYCESSDCDNQFQAKRDTARYCSTTCKARENWRVRHGKALPHKITCDHCSKVFETTDGRRNYCSDKCRMAEKLKRKSNDVNREPKPCKNCKKLFVPKSYRHFYCSDTCRKTLHRKKNGWTPKEPPVFHVNEPGGVELAKWLRRRRGHVETRLVA